MTIGELVKTAEDIEATRDHRDNWLRLFFYDIEREGTLESTGG